MTVGLLCDLLLATKAVGHNDRRKAGLAHFGQQLAFAARNRYLVFILLVTERTRHPAATGFEDLVVKAHVFHQRFFFLETHDRLVMAVSLYDGSPVHPRRL